MLKWLAIITGAFVLIGIGLFLAGSMLPQNHIASRTTHLMSQTATIDSYLSGLAGKLGDTYTPAA